ncbi:MAG: M23 family metallopeptidase [Deltaproteobacteria bacterium]|nr:M23 family metallopeptidase [Deltaproteobacteria bacterium]MBW2071711.1 M23 family metallopeptidase [Deltaproteobacteria bacterium]
MAAGVVEFREPLVQGSVAKLVVSEVDEHSLVRGSWQGKPLGFYPLGPGKYGSLIGVDLGLPPGKYPLKIRVETGGKTTMLWQEDIQVVKKFYGIERLQLPERMVKLDSRTLKRVRREQQVFRQLWNKWTPERYWTGSFLKPVNGKLLSPFGRRRIINNEPRSPHSGIDLRARQGEPVMAANRGRVVLVGDYFFPGRSVVIDHGQGLFTMYFHLSKVKVQQGSMVERGTVIGLAGASGRASGPHLHWGVRLDGARVNPVELLEATGS